MSTLLEKGVPFTAINGATGTGAQPEQFSAPPSPDGSVRTIEYHAKTVPATALSVDLEASQDGGTTWSKKTTGIDMKTTPVGQFTVVGGVLLRFNIVTFTGGGTATVLITTS